MYSMIALHCISAIQGNLLNNHHTHTTLIIYSIQFIWHFILSFFIAQKYLQQRDRWDLPDKINAPYNQIFSHIPDTHALIILKGLHGPFLLFIQLAFFGVFCSSLLRETQRRSQNQTLQPIHWQLAQSWRLALLTQCLDLTQRLALRCLVRTQRLALIPRLALTRHWALAKQQHMLTTAAWTTCLGTYCGLGSEK